MAEKRKINLEIGLRKGRFVLEKFLRFENGRSIWLWKCDCGTMKELAWRNVQQGTSSCGCLAKELMSARQTTHGFYKNKLYKKERAARYGLLDRCYNIKNNQYYNYGARNIVVCFGWRNKESGLLNFLRDLGEAGKDLSIDRIDNNGNYSCGKCEECLENGWLMNCRWATDEQQSNNTRRNRFLILNGEKYTTSQLARLCGINKHTLRLRLNKGWKLEDAITVAPKPNNQFGK